MSVISDYAIQSANAGIISFCKFLSANDTGETGGHQAGIYISKPAATILFNTPGVKGQNKEKWVKIKWQEDFETDTRFIYYGRGTRNEYRITNFGKGFPFLESEYTGALFVLIKYSECDYSAFILNTEDEIQLFLDAYGMTPAETNRLIDIDTAVKTDSEASLINHFVNAQHGIFPPSEKMSEAARMISYQLGIKPDFTIISPDDLLLTWTSQEYSLFRSLEMAAYGARIERGFSNIDDFISLSNQVLNRRKSRAGKSLEHHLAAIFDANNIQYTAQGITEGGKKPDFIFPSEEAYHDQGFDVNNLLTLAAKTTCKDRWRQVLNEADRLRNGNKYLCTLQQGISEVQMDEMLSEKVVLIVPKAYISTYPKNRQERIWTLERFIHFVKEKEICVKRQQ